MGVRFPRKLCGHSLLKMHLKTKSLVVVLISTLVTSHSFAKPDFDNSDIPVGVVVGFAGGCGTVTGFEPVTNVRPRYTDRQRGQGQIGGLGSGGEISQVLSVIPGVGAVAAIVGGAATALIGNAIVSDVNRQIDENAAKEQKWDKTYLLTIKPDFGDTFTVPYEKINQRDPDVGSRVQLKSAALEPNSSNNVVIYFAGNTDFGEPGTEKYLTSCYASYAPAGWNVYKFRQLSYNGQEFEWKKLDPKIKASEDAYFAKKAAEDAQKKADAAEAASYDHR